MGFNIATNCQKVILTGMMGAGKSTVAPLLAFLLGWEVIDTDKKIIEKYGPLENLEPPEMPIEDARAQFAEAEEDIVSSIKEYTEVVVSTGGRTLANSNNIPPLGIELPYCVNAANRVRVFTLSCPLNISIDRVRAQEGRDYILERLADSSSAVNYREAVVESFAKIYEERKILYGQYEQVDTNNRSPQEIAEDIFARLPSP